MVAVLWEDSVPYILTAAKMSPQVATIPMIFTNLVDVAQILCKKTPTQNHEPYLYPIGIYIPHNHDDASHKRHSPQDVSLILHVHPLS
jgi:hypothetical protein